MWELHGQLWITITGFFREVPMNCVFKNVTCNIYSPLNDWPYGHSWCICTSDTPPGRFFGRHYLCGVPKPWKSLHITEGKRAEGTYSSFVSLKHVLVQDKVFAVFIQTAEKPCSNLSILSTSQGFPTYYLIQPQGSNLVLLVLIAPWF